MKIRHTARARQEIQQAAQWWLENRREASDVFERELRRAFYLLLAHPHVGQPVAHLENVRRLHWSRVRYFLYYRVEENAILLLALWHTSRGVPGL
jgi:plasmid stabilization system protein ParE